MKNFIDQMVEKLRVNFTTMDFGFLKVYGALFGAVLGAYFNEFVLENVFWIACLFAILLVRFMYLIFMPRKA